MKIFNLDMHMSVIEDIMLLLTEQGHETTSWNVSCRSFVFGRPKARVAVYNDLNWHDCSERHRHAFYMRYKDELKDYDAFLTTHLPCFAWLFEPWGKPIICVVSTRYEAPFSQRPAEWKKFNEFLRSSQVQLVANNKHDLECVKHFTGREAVHIPSLCEYAIREDYRGGTYAPSREDFLFYSRWDKYTDLAGAPIAHLTSKKHSFPDRHEFSDMGTFRGIVGLPYQTSTMSLFEFYTQNIPLFFPTRELLARCWLQCPEHILADMSWNRVNHSPAASSIEGLSEAPDPNAYDELSSVYHWAQYADYYDAEWMPHITYFDSFEELRRILATITDDELMCISERMKQANAWRRQEVRKRWRDVLHDVVNFIA